MEAIPAMIRRTTLISILGWLPLLAMPSCAGNRTGPQSHREPITTLHEAPTESASPRIVDFQPGIRIDFSIPQVEVEGEVILRRGELELFAYSKAPTPKQHETILLLRSKPESIYHALGLIGLKPGHPVSYDWQTQVTTPAAGDPVDVLVRYESDGKEIEISACDWMLDLKRQRPMARRHWLFAGSTRMEDGQFFADVDGTVVTVVNFNSSLLTLPESHSESNAELWLAANTEAIPAVGTPVTLILRPVKRE